MHLQKTYRGLSVHLFIKVYINVYKMHGSISNQFYRSLFEDSPTALKQFPIYEHIPDIVVEHKFLLILNMNSQKKL